MKTLIVFALWILACHALQRTQSQQGKNARGQVSQLASTQLYNKEGHQVFRSLSKGYPTPLEDDTYIGGDKAADDMNVFAAGYGDTVAQVLATITQFDDSSSTRYDEDRCGAAVTVAAAINAGLVGPLIDFICAHSSKPSLPRPNKAKRDLLKHIKNRFAARTVTWGEVGKLQDILYEHWSVVHGHDHTGMAGGQLHNLFVGMGIPEASPDFVITTDEGGHFSASFAKGQSWPYIIHLPSGSAEPSAIHWILIGADAVTGNQFIYDPYTMTTDGPLFTELPAPTTPTGASTGPAPADSAELNSLRYSQYKTWLITRALSGSGWAPRTRVQTREDLRLEGL